MSLNPIYDVINDVLYKKQGHLLNEPEAIASFTPYMISRYVSMHSDTNAVIVNETANILWSTFQTKEEWYKFYLTVIPKSKFKKLNYIKKQEKKKPTKDTDEVDMVKLIAETYQISHREARLYLEQKNEA